MTADEIERDLLCDWCGEVFRPARTAGRTPRYCRRSCRQRAYEERVVQRRLAERARERE